MNIFVSTRPPEICRAAELAARPGSRDLRRSQHRHQRARIPYREAEAARLLAPQFCEPRILILDAPSSVGTVTEDRILSAWRRVKNRHHLDLHRVSGACADRICHRARPPAEEGTHESSWPRRLLHDLHQKRSSKKNSEAI
jgi:hypothetical protein